MLRKGAGRLRREEGIFASEIGPDYIFTIFLFQGSPKESWPVKLAARRSKSLFCAQNTDTNYDHFIAPIIF